MCRQTSLGDLYGYLLKRPKSSSQLDQIHAQIIVSGLHQDNSLIMKLIISLMACGKQMIASLIFNQVEYPNVLWTSMIRGYSCYGHFRESILLYARMRHQHLCPNNFSFPFVLKSCAGLKALSEGEQIHADVVKLGFVSDVFVQTSVLDMYVKCSRIETAKQVFDGMTVKNVVSWTAIIAGYCRHGFLDMAQELFHDMPVRNVVTWNALIDGLAQFGDIERARWYFDHMPEKNTVSWTIMIGGYSRAGDVANARLLFDKMIDKEVVAWTVMISCYVQNGKPGEAIKLFHEMLRTNIMVDEVIMLALISAATQLGSLNVCAWIENCISECGFGSDIRILNAVVNMYVQCGNIEKAFNAFKKIPKKDVISYNSMITGYAHHGDANCALSLFSMMIDAKIQPNSITFTGILTACAHRGLVDEGRRYFHLMRDLGSIVPKMEHYACMVDLLGRAGFIDEAHNLISSMPIRPEASIWGALLGACKIHGNLELAESIAQKLFEIEPENPGNYAILANMYVERKMWDAATRVRMMMKRRGVCKTPGSSWAEVSQLFDFGCQIRI
ncbi:PREDICTED: putative pentatricopeptide repeat-containing protein At5g37570 isoform X2 [Nelumbo nucifera]|uniref:Pentatricopeptide repeat-containing protein At5g37570 isoform X2 n=1 Tax=Nelumbo nucifera TaxID=4432 RepID=A0A1U7YX61_NELNU|nr:PREDICTED: putative pentatricopeptide repeat-containing protein At5g37570 isoform X2 [Nelumbo nucifera]